MSKTKLTIYFHQCQTSGKHIRLLHDATDQGFLLLGTRVVEVEGFEELTPQQELAALRLQVQRVRAAANIEEAQLRAEIAHIEEYMAVVSS